MGLFRALRRGATWAALGVTGGAVVITARHLLATPQPLESALPGEERIDRQHGGDIFYNVAGPADAEPLVLLHDFYPGASNYEFHDVLRPLADFARVYAPDWLGYGMSEHPHVAYTGEFYAGVLTGFLRDVVQRPAAVLAHGRAANIAVRAASDAPALFSRLILVSPDTAAGMQPEPTVAQTVVRATERTMLGLVPYALLSTRPFLRWLANTRAGQVGSGPSSAESVQHLYASAHQFGGQYALLPVLTGELDLPIHSPFELLERPVLIISGDHDMRHPRAEMEDLAVLNPRADLDVIPGAGAAVMQDRPAELVAAVRQWLIAAPASPRQVSAAAQASQATPASAHARADTGADTTRPSSSGETTPPTGATGATEEQMTSATGNASAPPMPEEPSVGEPGYVVPGVSDMGLEGPSTITTSITSSGTEGADVPTLGAGAEMSGVPVDAQDEPVAYLVPEAGESEPGESANRLAREGVNPPLEPADNIASVTESAERTARNHSRGEAGVSPATIVPSSEEPPAPLADQPMLPLPRVPARQPAPRAQTSPPSQQTQRAPAREPMPRAKRENQHRTPGASTRQQVQAGEKSSNARSTGAKSVSSKSAGGKAGQRRSSSRKSGH